MKNINLENSVQISNGLTETSADGASLAYDKKYGIMFCAYMPGPQEHYGESRGKISLSYFPASQPTNIRYVTIDASRDTYCPNILGLGDGKVRVFYEKYSRDDCDHFISYKDFNFLTGELGQEEIIMLKKEDGTKVPLTQTQQFDYLRSKGYFNQEYRKSEQIAFGSHTIFRGDDNLLYGAITSYVAEPILYRSDDNLSSIEFFAICPYECQYEFDYKFVDGKIYGIGRTQRETDNIFTTSSDDMGKSWTERVYLKDSIGCRPRIINYNGSFLTACNIYYNNTRHRPDIQQGRGSIKLSYGPDKIPVAELCSKYGIVNVCIIDILGDVYLAYSTSELALEYQNGNPRVRGKDAIRYIKLGDLIPEDK